ncbi:hypothetical protein V5O48_011591 [Marasmius crinis-equi]|uniref:Uncharacterized protein n=1 Tax=Marasmius crinis-equi TaxID=585013 RepID=A0ABR3F5J4_9AGAR
MARTPRNHASSSTTTSRQPRERESVETEREENALLESYIVLANQLKTRLLHTQDEKNLLAQQHTQELSDAREAWERLQLRYERSKQVIRTVKKERDDLKESFEILLQKVEVCNNFSSWPFPRIQLSSVLPEARLETATTTPASTETSSNLYNASIISRLTHERDEARTERDLVIRESAAKFSMLEAQLALREAELLSLQNENELNRTIRSSRPTNTTLATSDNSNSQPPLSSDDAIRILQYNAAKNRTIQIDVRKLKKRLETAREKPLEAGPSVRRSSSPIPQISPRPEPTRVVDEFAREVQELASRIDSIQLERARQLTEIARERTETPEAKADNQRVPSPRSRSESPGHGSEPACDSCQRLIEEISRLKAQISELDPPLKTSCDSCEHLSKENARLQARVNELQQLFFPSQTTSPVPTPPPPSFPPQPPPASTSPRASSHSSPQPQPSISPPPDSPPASPQIGPSDPEADDDGERSMELATPVFPSTIVLPPSSRNSSASRSSRSLIPSTPPSAQSHDSHPSVRWESPSVSVLLSPFVSSESGSVDEIVDVVSPAAAGLLIDLDGEERGSDGGRLDVDDQDSQDLHRPSSSQFRLSELELDHERQWREREREAEEDGDENDLTATPSSYLRPPSPPSRARTPSLESVQDEGSIDDLRDMILELMPDLGREAHR